MIWQEHVPVIVMITRLVEKNKVEKPFLKILEQTSFFCTSQNVNDIFRNYKRINMVHFMWKLNQ
jgi:hypothetical protein